MTRAGASTAGAVPVRAVRTRVTRAMGGLLSVVALATGASVAQAQEAIVLSGGGARGIAHAGVLIGLERRGHSPTIVVGTSMGAIVGALYAAGYAPDSIAALLDLEDWRATFAPPALAVGPLRQTVRPLITFGVGDDELVLGGLVPDIGINRRLVELLFDAGARARGDFDRLPRRYRAIAADLGDGSVVPLANGDLARAARASMAVPGAFSPIVHDGRTLVDGGIADNLPVSHARAIGASYVIASDVLNPYLDPIPSSRVAIGVRAIRLLIENAAPDGPPADVLVQPRVPPEMSEAMFPADAKPLLDAGLDAALQTIPERVPPAPPANAPAPLEALADTVIVENVNARLQGLVRAVFDPVVGGRYDAARILRRVTQLYATGMFRGVWPRVEQRAEGATLIVRAEAVPPSILSLAAGFNDRRGLRGMITLHHRVNVFGAADLRGTAAAHRDLRAGAFEITRPFARRADVALGAGLHYAERDVLRFIEDDPTSVERIGGWIGTDWRSTGGRHIASLQWTVEQVDGASIDGVSTGPTLRWTETPPYPPIVGVPEEVDAGIRFGDVAYARIHARGSLVHTFGPLATALVADVAAADTDAPADALFALGAADALPWIETGALRGARRIIIGADVAYPIFLDGAVRIRARAGGIAGSIEDLGSDSAWRMGGEVGAIWPTSFGALAGGFAFGERGENRFTIELGSTF